MADAREEFEKVARAYTNGGATFKDVERAHSKLIKQNKKTDPNGVNMDFIDLDSYRKDREKNVKDVMKKVSDPGAIDKKGWKFLKKEAGVSDSGFMRKADAKVGKHLEKYKKDYNSWSKSTFVTPGGDIRHCENLLKSCRELRAALESFMTAKELKAEFETGVAKKLRKMCIRMCASLDGTESSLLRTLSDQDKGRRDMVNHLKKAGLW
ncbi:hypothetical protein M1105_01630 [Limibaculum sp. FT325]|uniref:hypothetical protein n=1 Tax=Thermohalobaculum sediminis TaxID=2939436 RepID=UPI0020C045E5|nr:hypothetical protein [Limibaculum sediminis]MCL5775697.1 hypothetical protein [Limibaculum sediminis]